MSTNEDNVRPRDTWWTEQRPVVTGAITYSACPDLLPSVAAAGFDYIQIDHMFGGLSWRDSVEMARSAHAAGLVPLIRLQTEPWVRQYNKQVAIDAARAVSIGYEGVSWSVTAPEEVEEVIQATAGWHRDLASVPFDRDSFSEFQEASSGDTMVIPVIESPRALEMVEELAATPRVDVILCGTTDLTVQLGHGMNADHPDVWAAVERTREACHANGKKLWVNPGMGYSTFPEMIDRVQRLVAAGADMILFQTLELLIKMAAREVVTGGLGQEHDTDA